MIHQLKLLQCFLRRCDSLVRRGVQSVTPGELNDLRVSFNRRRQVALTRRTFQRHGEIVVSCHKHLRELRQVFVSLKRLEVKRFHSAFCCENCLNVLSHLV